MKSLLTPAHRVSTATAVGVAIVGPAIATALALPLETADVIAVSLYLLAVVVSSAVGGLRAGVVSSVLAFLGLNFFFTEPEHTFRVGKTEDLVALIVFLIVAVVVGALLARALEERDRAARRERETNLLNYFSSKLLSGEPLPRVLKDFATALLDPLALARCEIHARAGGTAIDAVGEREGVGEGPASVLPLLVGDIEFGTLTAVRRPGRSELAGADLKLLETCARQVAVAIERSRLDTQVEGARIDAERNQLRAALFSSVTHDLRTPLASIKASVTSLLDEDAVHDPDQERELLRTVLEETDRLNRLVGNLLDLARVRAGALLPSKEPTAFEDVLDAVLHRMASTLSHLRLRTQIRPDVPDVPMDPVQIDQVLTNLLENAARFSPPGGELFVSVSPWHRAVQVRVVDQGPGIPREEREHVFEAFYSRDAGDGRSGSGLGLAIARAIVLGHGGRIWVEGAPGGGTAVVFELPTADAEPVPQEPSP